LKDAKRLKLNVKVEKVDVDKKIQEHDEFIDKLIAKKKIILLANKDEYLSCVVNNAVQRIPPFCNEGDDRGFKDALIWEAVKDFAKQKGDIFFAFITTNTNDFSDRTSKEKIHPELFKEISSPLNFKYFQSLEAFLEKYCTPIEGINRSSVYEAVKISFKGKILKVPDMELEDIFHHGVNFNTYDVDRATMECTLKNFFINGTKDGDYIVAANGFITADVITYNPIDDDYFAEDSLAPYEAVLRFDKKDNSMILETFELYPMPRPNL
jgi:hypothetical protein